MNRKLLFAACLGGFLFAASAFAQSPEGPRGRAGDPLSRPGESRFERRDRNHDGLLTRDELPPRAARLFQRAGKDALTRADLRALRGQVLRHGLRLDRLQRRQRLRELHRNHPLLFGELMRFRREHPRLFAMLRRLFAEHRAPMHLRAPQRDAPRNSAGPRGRGDRAPAREQRRESI